MSADGWMRWKFLPPVSPTMRGLDTKTKYNKSVSTPPEDQEHEGDALGTVVGDVDSNLLPEGTQDVGRPGKVKGGKVLVRDAPVDNGGCVSLDDLRWIDGQLQAAGQRREEEGDEPAQTG